MLGDKLLAKSKVREGEHSIKLPNGATIRIFGADNFDSLRGNYFDGVILDEVADMHPDVWSKVVRPALMDRKGWAVFIGTPKGHNFFYTQREKARTNKGGNWFYLELKASESGLLPQAEIDETRQELDDDEYMQEMECSFDAAIKGAYYAKELAKAYEEGRLQPFDHVQGASVHAAFDLGWNDSTAVWFYQVVNGRIDVVGHYEVNGLAIPNIVEEIKALYATNKWKMGDWYMPHDAAAKSLQTGKSILEQLRSLGVSPRKVANIEVQHGIQAVRKTFPFIRINGQACYQGIEALKSYQKKWNPKLGTFSREPVHDWASHSADAFRYLCLAVRDSDVDLSKPAPPSVAPQQPTPLNRKTVDVSAISDFTDEDIRFIESRGQKTDYIRI
jgi:phage terminase large subunit